MSEQQVQYYEAMFLFSQAQAADLGGVVEHMHEILRRAEAEVVAIKKWDERRLAYEIDRQKRGVFVLVYFTAGPDRITGIERDCNLSEKVLRVMVTRADHLTVEEMQAADAREELESEMKLRSEKASAEEEKASTGVTLGAPEQAAGEEPAPAPAPAPAEAPAEAPAAAPAAAPAEAPAAAPTEPVAGSASAGEAEPA